MDKLVTLLQATNHQALMVSLGLEPLELDIKALIQELLVLVQEQDLGQPQDLAIPSRPKNIDL